MFFKKRTAQPRESLVSYLARSAMIPKRILILEDDRLFSGWLMGFLKRYLVDSFFCQSIDQARNRMVNLEFDAAILDYEPFNGDSLDLYRSILRSSPKTVVIFLTGYDSPGVRREIEAIGPARCHSKDRLKERDFIEALLLQIGIPEKSGAGLTAGAPA